MIVPKPSIKKSLGEATLRYHEQLLKDDEALSYLLDHRGFSKEALEYFKLGVVRAPMDGHERFKGRITFPYHTTTGVVSIRFRILGEVKGKQKKFLALTGDVNRPYNVTAVNSPKVYVCEGETDTITCWMAGLPVIGIPGAKNWKKSFAGILRNREVVVLADNDDKPEDPGDDNSGPGKKLAEQIYRDLNGCDIITPPPGYDINKFYREFGLEALREKAGWNEEGASGESRRT